MKRGLKIILFFLLLVILISSSSASLLNGIVAYWKLDESSGDAIDETGNNNGTVDATQNEGGVIGTSYGFDGSLDEIDLGNDSSLKPTDGLTVSCWFKQYLYSGGIMGTYSSGEGWAFETLSSTGYLSFIMYESWSFDQVDGTISVTTGSPLVWYHVAATFNGTHAQLYVNGSPDGNPVEFSVNLSYNADNLTIGYVEALAGRNSGWLDEIGFWNRSLTAEEIARLYNSGIGLTYPFTTPTYSQVSHNSTLADQLTKFSVNVSDEIALHPNGQYIFSTNNTGTWVNDSAINFTSTPSWANVTKILNSTEGTVVGYKWYFNDTAGNPNSTSIYTLTAVSDTTAPYFISLSNRTGYINQSFFFVLNATDDGIGIDVFSLNDTSNFTINFTTGIITNATGLTEAYLYTLNLSVNDTLGNLNWTVFTINITATPTTYYIDESGDDSTGDGSSGNPWASLYYACSQVTTSGHTIHVNAGTYNESSQCNLAVGVNIEGDGDTSIISSNISGSYTPTIRLYSASEGTNGNQTISNIKMEGTNTAWSAITVFARSNVSIYSSTFSNFFKYGVSFSGRNDIGSTPPTTYATGNKFYNNNLANCSDFETGGDGYGEFQFGGQEGMEIYNNYMTSIDRATRRNGYPIKFFAGGYNKDFKIYNNTLITANDSNSGLFYDFAMELWHTKGGAQIYNNTMMAGIDFGGAYTYICLEKGSYDYGAWVYNNTIGPTSSITSRVGIYLECSTEGAIIEKNLFKNLHAGISISPNAACSGQNVSQNHTIRYNVFNNITNYGLYSTNDGTGAVVDSIDIFNNVFYAPAATANLVGISVFTLGETTNLNISNNIIQGFDYAAIYGNGASGQTVDNLTILNNLLYNNANGNEPLFNSLTPTNYTNAGNVTEDPLFTNAPDNLHLRTGSPAIDAGIDLGLSTDFEWVSVGSPPNIGAYETIVDDYTDPTITLNLPVDTHNSSNSSVEFSAVVSDDTAVDTVILYGNFSGSWGINETNSSGINNTQYNFTIGLEDGYYEWGYWANDTAGNSVFSSNRTLTVDSTNPNVTINSPTNQTYTTSSVTFNVTATDDIGINSCWYSIDSGATNTTLDNSGDFYSKSATLSNAAYTVNFYCTDTLNNLNNTESVSFTVSVTSETEDTSGGGSVTYSPTEEQLEEGYEKILAEGWKINVEHNNRTYELRVEKIYSNSVALSLANQTFNMTINETKKINLDGDDSYDLEVLLNNIIRNGADLRFKEIHEEIPAEEKEKQESPSKIIDISKIKDWMWITGGVIN